MNLKSKRMRNWALTHGTKEDLVRCGQWGDHSKVMHRSKTDVQLLQGQWGSRWPKETQRETGRGRQANGVDRGEEKKERERERERVNDRKWVCVWPQLLSFTGCWVRQNACGWPSHEPALNPALIGPLGDPLHNYMPEVSVRRHI